LSGEDIRVKQYC